MNYEEFVSYTSGSLNSLLSDKFYFWTEEQTIAYYYKVCANSLIKCAALLNKLMIDEGIHNDYNPNSRASINEYKKDLFVEIAKGFGAEVVGRSNENHELFLERVTKGNWRRGQRFRQEDYCRAFIIYHSNFSFIRTCKNCGAKYKMTIDLQTYRAYAESPPEKCIKIQTAAELKQAQFEEELKQISHENILRRFEAGRKHNQDKGSN